MTVQKVTQAFLAQRPLPDHADAGDKQARGRVLVVAGSVNMPGTALLAATGVLRAGAGIVQIATGRSGAPQLRLSMPEALVMGCKETKAGGIQPSEAANVAQLAKDCDAVLIGPGMVDDDAVAALLFRLVSKMPRQRFVIDAEAFVQLRARPGILKEHGTQVIVTPHSGELASFLGVKREEVDADPAKFARQVAESIGAVVALKGEETNIFEADGNEWLVQHGCIGLATSGSGDTLAGIIAGLVARGASLAAATYWGTYIHAEAGQRLSARVGRLGFLAREISREIPRILEDLRVG